MVPRLFAPILGLFLWGEYMNIRIEKVDINNNEALDFIALEYLKMFLELSPNMRKVYSGNNKEKLINDYIENYKQEYVRNDSTIYVAFYDEDIVGALQMNGDSDLSCLFVKEEYRNRLIGSKLLERLISECHNLKVIRVDARVQAVPLFEKFSFRKDESAINRTFIPMELEMRKHGR